jgi:stage III sporulation protein AF
MFEYLYGWLEDLSFYLILVTAVLYVLPSNSYRKYIRFFTGLVLILLLLNPILNLFGNKNLGSEDLIREFEKVYKKPELILEDEEYEKKESVQIEVEEIVIGP